MMFVSSLPEAGVIRRACFDVFITDDDFYENTEHFDVLLEPDASTPQFVSRVEPPITRVFIIDDDGKFCYGVAKFHIIKLPTPFSHCDWLHNIRFCVI